MYESRVKRRATVVPTEPAAEEAPSQEEPPP